MSPTWRYCALIVAEFVATHAGIGYSVVRLNPCSASTSVLPYQQWNYDAAAGKISLQTYKLWGSSAGFSSVGPIVEMAEIWCPPGGSMVLNMSADGSRTTIVEKSTGLCVTILGNVSAPGASLSLQTCASGSVQQFQYNAGTGLLTHADSLFCVDAGSKVAPCTVGSLGADLPFCNSSLPIDTRVSDLITRLSDDDKANMLDTSSGGAASLGIPPYQWWNEGLHGIADNVGVAFVAPTPYSTSFPMAITSSCSFNRSLWLAIGTAVSTEGRAFANAGHTGGLTFWTPTINMGRDPRWGRIQETPGEDTLVSGAYASQYVLGMQAGPNTGYLKVSSTCKHFAAYSLELWNGTARHAFNAIVDDADLAEYYLLPFQACVTEGHASAIMCSYNAVNGVPACANSFLMNDIARDTWGFDGYITSDCGAVTDIPTQHHYTNSTDGTVAATLKAGMDIGCDDYLADAGVISSALADGSITQADLDSALSHLFRVRMRLGEFDPPAAQPYMAIPPSAVCSADHIALARDAARQSIVLLSNPHGALPLSRAVKSVALVGPQGNNTYINGGPNYNGVPCGTAEAPGIPSTILSALIAAQLAVTFVPACEDCHCTSNTSFAAAVSAAASTDFTIVAVGIDQTFENEGLDRVDIDLPGLQAQLTQSVCAAAKGPCVLVVVSGGAIDISAVLLSVSAAFYIGLPGAVGADALVDLLFGDAVPAGRMTQTVYPQSLTSAVSLFDMGMRPGPSPWPPGSNPGRTYQWYTGTPVFPFGFGLSYTTWSVSPVTGPDTLSTAISRTYLDSAPAHRGLFAPLTSAVVASYTVNVTNTGSLDADYVVLGFLSQPGAGSNGVPLKQLFGFERVFVSAGQTVTVWLGLQARHLTAVVPSARPDAAYESVPMSGLQRVPVPGLYTLRVGVQWEGQEYSALQVHVA